jgi:hypothetical protein
MQRKPPLPTIDSSRRQAPGPPAPPPRPVPAQGPHPALPGIGQAQGPPAAPPRPVQAQGPHPTLPRIGQAQGPFAAATALPHPRPALGLPAAPRDGSAPATFAAAAALPVPALPVPAAASLLRPRSAPTPVPATAAMRGSESASDSTSLPVASGLAPRRGSGSAPTPVPAAAALPGLGRAAVSAAHATLRPEEGGVDAVSSHRDALATRVAPKDIVGAVFNPWDAWAIRDAHDEGGEFRALRLTLPELKAVRDERHLRSAAHRLDTAKNPFDSALEDPNHLRANALQRHSRNDEKAILGMRVDSNLLRTPALPGAIARRDNIVSTARDPNMAIAVALHPQASTGEHTGEELQTRNILVLAQVRRDEQKHVASTLASAQSFDASYGETQQTLHRTASYERMYRDGLEIHQMWVAQDVHDIKIEKLGKGDGLKYKGPYGLPPLREHPTMSESALRVSHGENIQPGVQGRGGASVQGRQPPRK